ncbi:V-type H+-transporting ATPase subunit I [Kwoniella heveanensis CBS 569]|uniref:V-type proton ATPase subunit a n=1 Tax=Kwoniella heveanensis BCC8398 TaxID=1296120 RepID=A0A1B9GJZ0_9TREE|nr:V-type H+-transporting ATPase subunit I [Kwoniella heveanensis BCC8398]OCF43933.1 V-type H+-transporting ATPase subunit I [Kwoniella heveanensis CBS 569]
MSSTYPSLFRSEEMSLVQLYIPSEVAHDTVSELAEMGNFQFKDLNPSLTSFQRPFTPRLRRLAESSRRLRLFRSQITGLTPTLGIPPLSAVPPFTTVGPRAQNAYDELEDKLKEHERRLADMNKSWEELGKRKSELEEKRWVLRETAGFFNEAEHRHTEIRTSFDEGDNAPLLEHAAEYGNLPGDTGFSGFDLEFVSGTIERTRMPTFERILWRVLRGNLYMNYSEIEEAFVDPISGKETHKDVFIIFAHGEELLSKIRKVAESMGGTLYNIDSSQDKRADALREVSARLEDVESILYNMGQTRRVELSKIAEMLEGWTDAVRREEEIFKTLNLLSYDQSRKTLVAEGWCPSRDITAIQLGLRRAMDTAGTSVPAILSELRTHQTPPTFHRTNKFTEGFQTLIDSYGIATYQEVNPGLFAVITFPFLFAVMFGDIGHGILMFLTAAAMIWWEKPIAKNGVNENLETFFFGRYLIVLMGAFSVYTGLMYNDIFSKSLHLFQSGWEWPRGETGLVLAERTGHIYPFGLDPGWHGADNSLIFNNSYKMKLSIILGVIHMTFAICLQVPNHIHFKKPLNIYAEFIPQILFFHSIFGYLVVCIIYKWSVDWSQSPTGPPGLLNMLIYMFLSPGTIADGTPLFPGQAFIQVVLLLIALVCVPWMLCLKPYVLWKEHNRIKGQGYSGIGGQENGRASTSEHIDEEEEEVGMAVAESTDDDHPFEMGDIVVHQVIHTIEFCLGCISNTASYLRLWALSLAHAQLSEVLWDMTIALALEYEGGVIGGGIFLFLMFGGWFVGTIGILCTMEGLSAFLHALRLHWVEANGKHYMAGGYAFTPLSFATLGAEEE